MTARDANDRAGPRQEMIDVVKAAFKNVLKLEDVADDDDFFDLGGDSLAATALMMMLDTIGARVPASVLFDAPTPAGLASLIESGGLLHEVSLATLKPGDARQPVFIVSGAGGSVLEMVPFARRIETARLVCGLQPRDGNGGRLTFDTIEHAARFYLPLIRASQPHGPYILAGYSSGGMIALELAHRIMAADEAVELLIILDTLTPIEHFSFSGKLRVWLRRAVTHAREAAQLPRKQIVPYVLGRTQALARDFRSRVPVDMAHSRSIGSSLQATASQHTLTQAATTFVRYRPKFFSGNVVFIKSRGVAGKVFYPDILWRRLARSVVILDVEGDHETMLFNHQVSTAAAMSRALNLVDAAKAITEA